MFGSWWICQTDEKLSEASGFSRSKQMPRDLWNVSKHGLWPRVFSQKPGIDYDETFSPVPGFESVRTVIPLAVQNNLKLHQIDVTNAFLNDDLRDEVYMKQPEGFVVKGQEHLVCKLKRSIYGLKQLSRCWNTVLDQHLKKIAFVQTVSDPCIYVASEGEMFMIAVHVDDLVLAAKNRQAHRGRKESSR